MAKFESSSAEVERLMRAKNLIEADEATLLTADFHTVLKKDLGYDDAPLLEKLLIQQAALCWLKLNLVELSYSGTMKQSITLTVGIYWKKRLTASAPSSGSQLDEKLC